MSSRRSVPVQKKTNDKIGFEQYTKQMENQKEFQIDAKKKKRRSAGVTGQT